MPSVPASTPVMPSFAPYTDSIERSTEVLRQALQLMTRHGAALHPTSYAVWYEYARGENTALRVAIDQYLQQHLRFDNAITDALYRRFVVEKHIDPEVIERMAEGVASVLSGMAETAARAGDQTAQYGSTLSRLSAELAENRAGSALEEVLATTRQMQGAIVDLQRQLTDSQREIGQLRDELDRVRQDAMIDSLTGLANRRAFDQRMAAALAVSASAAWHSQIPCLLIVDLDHFKRVNDSFGHMFGDQVLRTVGQLLKELTPAGAVAARIGGEEFAVLLPISHLTNARALAEKIRTQVATTRIRRPGQPEGYARITVSIGVTTFSPGETPTQFIDRADHALYASKKGGRDRVTAQAA